MLGDRRWSQFRPLFLLLPLFSKQRFQYFLRRALVWLDVVDRAYHGHPLASVRAYRNAFAVTRDCDNRVFFRWRWWLSVVPKSLHRFAQAPGFAVPRR